MDDFVRHRVKLHFLEDAVVDLAVKAELKAEHLRIVHQAVQFEFSDMEVMLLTESVEHPGDPFALAQLARIFFPYAPTGGAAQ